MKHLIFAFTILCLVSCSESLEKVDNFLDCDQVGENYKAYSEEKIDCESHYMLTEYNGQQYIELRSHCGDLTRPFVINEYCKDICETLPYDENSECGKYLQGRVEKEILLIEK